MLTNTLFKWFVDSWTAKPSDDQNVRVVRRQKPDIDYTANDCFENRIYDDLCEDILDWLPFDDKIRLKGVSHQFYFCLNNVLTKRRRVFKVDKTRRDVDNLVLSNAWVDRRPRILQGLQATDDLLSSLDPVKITKLDRYLMTCPNTVGFISGRYTCIANKMRVLESLIKHCPNLETIAFDFDDIPQEFVIMFGERFGKTLKSLEFCQNIFEIPQNSQPLIPKCSNLTSLVNVNFDHLFDHEDNIYLSNLTRFKSLNVNNKRRFRIFVKQNPEMARLMVRFTSVSSSDLSDCLFQISKLDKLIYLEIQFTDFNNHDYHLTESFYSIVRNCAQLKNLKLRVDSVQKFDLSHFLQSFKRLYSLRRLTVAIHPLVPTVPLKTGFLDVSNIKNCRELVHLDLTYDNIDDQFFQGIHILFPNLRTVYIKCKHELTDETLVSFGKVKRLRTLIIERKDKKPMKTITDLGILSLLNGCRQLTLLEIHNPIKITDVSLLAMIRKAVRHTDLRFKYYIEEIESQLDLRQYSGYEDRPMPKNLVVMGNSYYTNL